MTEAEPGPNSVLSEYYYDPHMLTWYEPKLTDAEPKAREIVKMYSNIPPNEVVQYVNSLFRDPCTRFHRYKHPPTADLSKDPRASQSSLEAIGRWMALGQELCRLVYSL